MRRVNQHSTSPNGSPSNTKRRGAAIVEFAIMAPVFLVLTLGTVELGYALNASNTMFGALREGGRLASQDFSKTLNAGETANDKVIQDIKNMLTAARIPGDFVLVEIVDPDTGSVFDLEDPVNYLQMFTIKASVPYSDITNIPGHYMDGHDLVASVSFRMGRVQLTN